MKRNRDLIKNNVPVRTALIFILALLIASTVIFLSRRNDAVSVAEQRKAGVVTAEQIDVAFQGVGGRLVKRDIEESQFVHKGDVLMVLDPTDINISINKTKALIAQLTAQIDGEKESIAISTRQLATSQLQMWRQVEQAWASVLSTQAAFDNAQKEYNRTLSLVKSGTVSKSDHDMRTSTYLQARAAMIEAQQRFAELTVGASPQSINLLKSTGSANQMMLSTINDKKQEIENRKFTVASLIAQRNQNEEELKQLNINLERLTLRAPENGKILKILYKAGEMIPNSAPGVLLESERYYYDIYVNEKQASHIKVKQAIKGYVYAVDNIVNGTVRFNTAAPSFADLRMTREHGQADLTSFQVRIYIKPEHGILPGMTVEVDNDNL
ncbi:TolC family protein [Klebsiella pneumoniae]|nr:TolC family protein [Klebsiella pneumoniae]